MFYNYSNHTSRNSESGNDRVPGSRVLQRVDVPWDAPGSSECTFRMLCSLLHERVSVAD